MIGLTVAQYRITGKLGEGGMGVVYRAEDSRLQRTVALKFLSPEMLDDSEAKARFLREAQAAASLDHPNICTVYEIGEAEGRAYIAMAFIEGETIKDKVGKRPLPLAAALDIAVQACEGLQAAHKRGIVHRDIKSANLMLTREGKVKVMDFGLAQLAGQSGLTRSKTTLGTAAYMSPEQAQSRAVDHRTDLWSLGVVLHEMIAGQVPFQGENEAAVLYAVVHASPAPVTELRAGLPAALDRVLGKAMAKDPEDRYQHADDLLVDLRALQKGTPVRAPARFNRRNLLIGAGAAGAAAIGVALSLRTGSSPARISSLVVLPLDNLSGNPDQEYFADGMTDALTTGLSKIASLRTISRSTAMRYKGSKKPVREIAKELKVDAVVGGSVAREGARVRVTAQLIDASTDQNIWAESYERELASILTLQGEVARTIASKVSATLRPEEAKLLAGSRQVNPQTYEAYLKGLFWMNKGTPEAFDKAVTFLQEAVDKDPADPLAYAGLAIGYVTAAHLMDSPDYKVPRARAAAQRALQLDDTLADAHVALGVIEGYRDFQWEAAERRFKRAIELNPNYPFAHFQMGWLQVLYDRFDEAIASGRKTLELDPLSVVNYWVADFYRMSRRFKEAVAETTRAIEMNPQAFTARFVLANTYSDMGRHDEAIAEYKRAVAIAPGLLGYLGVGYAMAGRIEEAKQVLRRIEEMKLSGWTAFWRAGIHVLLGNKDEAIRMLSFQPHHDWLSSVRFPDAFKALHGDPRFLALVKRMNLPMPQVPRATA
jgi:serine/threonine-protein kinase